MMVGQKADVMVEQMADAMAGKKVAMTAHDLAVMWVHLKAGLKAAQKADWMAAVLERPMVEQWGQKMAEKLADTMAVLMGWRKVEMRDVHLVA